MYDNETREPQYQDYLNLKERKGVTSLGLATNQIYYEDPRHLVILLSRYKFVAKMLSGKAKVLEVGCGDAFGTRIVLQEVGSVCAVDFDPIFVEDVNRRNEHPWEIDCRVHDILSGPVEGQFDAAYALDVLEHIEKTYERTFISNLSSSTGDNGMVVIGLPSIQSQVYASPRSAKGHVNCKDQQDLKDLMEEFFHNVMIFSMNDEVVHTGFFGMAHYLFAICSGKKQS